MSDTRISIAMITYNSERFVRDQLESFARQERLPDELVVCDDASSDQTAQLVRDFAPTSPFPVRLFVNDDTLGIAKNFERAITECTGDIIFLSDADDYWYPHKIRVMEHSLLQTPSAGLAVCDADVVGERLNPLGTTAWEAFSRFPATPRLLMKIARGETYRTSMPAGACCMAFRAKFKPLVLPLPGGQRSRLMSHDHFIAQAIICSGAGGAALIPQSLLAYRRHPGQVTHDRRDTLLKRVSARLSARREAPYLLPLLIERLESDLASQLCGNPKIRSSALRHWCTRVEMPPSLVGRAPVVIRELVAYRYHRFSGGFATAAKDLFFSRRPVESPAYDEAPA